VRNTKWVHGAVSFEASGLPDELRRFEGVVPMRMTLDPLLGAEVVLVWIDRQPFIGDLAKVAPFNLLVKSGLVKTHHGPLLFIVFYVPNPASRDEPFVAIDCHVDPMQDAHMRLWKELATQSHLHVVFLDNQLEVVEVKEFPNIFKVAETLEIVVAECQGLKGGSFDDAKVEFCKRYTLDDLLAM